MKIMLKNEMVNKMRKALEILTSIPDSDQMNQDVYDRLARAEKELSDNLAELTAVRAPKRQSLKP